MDPVHLDHVAEAQRLAESIESNLKHIDLDISSWSKSQNYAIDEAERLFNKNLKKYRETANLLTIRQQTYAEEAEKVATELKAENEKEETLSTDLGKLRDIETQLPLSIQSLQTSEMQLAEEVARIRNNVQSCKVESDETISELTKSLEFYRRLGLEFRKTGDNLSFVFTQIERVDPEKEFVFALRIDENEGFVVTSCNPAVPEVEVLLLAHTM